VTECFGTSLLLLTDMIVLIRHNCNVTLYNLVRWSNQMHHGGCNSSPVEKQCHIYNVIYLVVKLLLISIKLLYIYFISHYFLILYHFISHYILLNNKYNLVRWSNQMHHGGCNSSPVEKQSLYTETCQKHSVTVIFYYIFHVKRHLLKTLFQNCMTSTFKTIISRRLLTSFTWTENVYL
jgi:hypothetical protein